MKEGWGGGLGRGSHNFVRALTNMVKMLFNMLWNVGSCNPQGP